jgi:hypothetical protein
MRWCYLLDLPVSDSNASETEELIIASRTESEAVYC